MVLKILNTILTKDPKIIYQATNQLVGCRYFTIVNRSPNEIELALNSPDFMPTNTITILPNSTYTLDIIQTNDISIQHIYARCLAGAAPVSCLFVELG